MPGHVTKLIPADPDVLATGVRAPCACCGAVLPGGDEGCRAAFGEVLAREFSDRAYGAVHLFTVDAHALQHSEWHGPRSNAVHLMRLGWLIERGGSAAIGSRGPLEDVAKRGPLEGWPTLAPPVARGEVTIADVYAVSAVADHTAIVRRWAESVWAAWSEHHAWARARLAGLIEGSS
jgi:hypothetical protein